MKLNSTNLDNVEYDPQTRVLTITFVSGATWEYANVPQAVYDGLISTSSPGGYFHRNIREHFAGSEI